MTCHRTPFATLILVGLMGWSAPAGAQTSAASAAPAAPAALEAEPVQCWWRTTTPAVLVGERFTVVLTCRVVETRTFTAVPDTSQLEPTTIQVTPFEVVEGVRHQDVTAPPWRYFQYEYTLRLVGDGSFGRDVQVPSVRIGYNLRGSAGAGSEGRDQSYALPPLPVRVLSLVSKQAADIRDGQAETFKGIEDRLFRATAEFVAACIVFGFAAILAIAAIIRVIAQRRRRMPTLAKPPAAALILRACLRGVRRVRSDVSGSGWTPDTLSRALAVCRLAAGVGLGRPFGYAIAYWDDPLREGQVALPRRLLKRTRAVVSAPTIPARIERATAAASGRGRSATRVAALSTLAEALRTLEHARYQRDGQIDAAGLDAALDGAGGAMRRLWLAELWPLRVVGSMGRSPADFDSAVASR
jgi:hypothetical protein